jgi:electron transfer flavoprotein alpha subunit
VASLLVYIETEGDRPLPISLEALGEGRRIASALGAALYTVVVLPGVEAGSLSVAHDELVRELGRYGADKTILMPTPGHDGPAVWATHGSALYAACEQYAPLLVLMAGDAVGRDVAPRLAARMGAAYISDPSIECGSRGEVVFSHSAYGRTVRRRLSSEAIDHPIVATLTPGSYRSERGEDEAEVILLEVPIERTSQIEYLDSTDDPGASLETAKVVVIGGAGVRDAKTYALLETLAEALGGEVAATRNLCERGIAPADREVGVGARHVVPSLYIVCGASGSSGHLGAVSSDAEIVAIDRDPDADIFRVASYGLVGELEDVIPQLIDALQDHEAVAASS